MKLLLDGRTIIFVDTVKFWSNDYNDKIWIKTNSRLHKESQERNKKKFQFDMIVASELNLGPIAIQAYESHHRSEDWAIFINKLIEQANNIFNF